jgi:quercetin dioxygenase-like cupin family protein
MLPPSPKGAQYVILTGDPTKAGSMVIQRVKPPNYQVPAHTHPHVVMETVLTGSMGFGMGDRLDTKKGGMLKPGSLLLIPPGHAHYVWTGNEDTIRQLQTLAPIGIDYINPTDDPRKK